MDAQHAWYLPGGMKDLLSPADYILALGNSLSSQQVQDQVQQMLAMDALGATEYRLQLPTVDKLYRALKLKPLLRPIPGFITNFRKDLKDGTLGARLALNAALDKRDAENDAMQVEQELQELLAGFDDDDETGQGMVFSAAALNAAVAQEEQERDLAAAQQQQQDDEYLAQVAAGISFTDQTKMAMQMFGDPAANYQQQQQQVEAERMDTGAVQVGVIYGAGVPAVQPHDDLQLVRGPPQPQPQPQQASQPKKARKAAQGKRAWELVGEAQLAEVKNVAICEGGKEGVEGGREGAAHHFYHFHPDQGFFRACIALHSIALVFLALHAGCLRFVQLSYARSLQAQDFPWTDLGRQAHYLLLTSVCGAMYAWCCAGRNSNKDSRADSPRKK